MKSLLFLFLFLSFSASASEKIVGYLRVRVPKNTKGHFWTVQLYANGHPVGPGFSHESSGFSWTPITEKMLSRGGRSTPIYASYGNIPVTICEFDYTIDFSMDGANSIGPLGTFKAPQNPNAGSIPLGLACGKDGSRLCSSDPALEQKIIAQINQLAKANYDNWKRDYDRAMAERRQRAEQKSRSLSKELVEKKNPNFDEAQKKFLEAKIREWQSQSDKSKQDQMRRDSEGEKKASEFKAEDAAKAAADAAQAERVKTALNQIGQSVSGEAVLNGVAADQNLERMIGIEKRFQQDAAASGLPGFEDDVRVSKSMVNGYDAVRREVLRGETFLKTVKLVVKTGVDISPSFISRPIKICEIVRGRDLCIGRGLNPRERLQKACKMALKETARWKRLKKAAEEIARDNMEESVVKIVDSEIRGGICDRLGVPEAN